MRRLPRSAARLVQQERAHRNIMLRGRKPRYPVSLLLLMPFAVWIMVG